MGVLIVWFGPLLQPPKFVLSFSGHRKLCSLHVSKRLESHWKQIPLNKVIAGMQLTGAVWIRTSDQVEGREPTLDGPTVCNSEESASAFSAIFGG